MMSAMRKIEHILDQLVSGNAVPASSWPKDSELSWSDLGLRMNADGALEWVVWPDLLDVARIRRQLPWLAVVHTPLLDSTNTQLMTKAQTASIANDLCICEFQYSGRGRRGRKWISPFARNLALSLGFSTHLSLSELGGLSLMVGIALADVLAGYGIADIQLKWPNDLLVSGCKLSGVLIELVQRERAVEFIVGIGVNVHLTADEEGQIEYPLTDLRRLGIRADRSALLIDVARRVHEYVTIYEHRGLSEHVSTFNDLHIFHGQSCRVLQGMQVIEGVVEGVGAQGELILQTSEGKQFLHGGEVSLRF